MPKISHHRPSYTWVDLLSTLLGTTGVILGTISLIKEPPKEDEEVSDLLVDGDLEVQNDATIQNHLSVGNNSSSTSTTRAKTNNDVSSLPRGVHIQGELDINTSAVRIDGSSIVTQLPYQSTSDVRARDIYATRDLQIDGKFVYLDVLEANNGLDVRRDLIVNDTDFGIYENFGSGYVGLTIPIQSNSSILASSFRATSDIQVDGDLYVTGHFDYKNTLVASSGLDVTGTIDANAGAWVVNETKVTSTIPLESSSDITCDNLQVVSIFDVNTSSFRVDVTNMSTTLPSIINNTLTVSGTSTFQDHLVLNSGKYLEIGDSETGLLGFGGGVFFLYSQGVPISRYDLDGLRVMYGNLRVPNGTNVAPSINVGIANSATGIYSDGVGLLKLVCETTNVLQMTPTEATHMLPSHFQYGSESAPSITFASDNKTGLWGGAQSIHVTCNGTTVASFSPITTTIRNDLLSPSYAFLTDPTTGIDMSVVGQLDLKAGNVVTSEWTSTSVDQHVPIYTINGSESEPSYSFQSNHSTGMYLDTSNLAFAINGSTVGRFQPDGLVLPPGLQTNPSLSFTGSPTTGLCVLGPVLSCIVNGERSLTCADDYVLAEQTLRLQNGSSLAPSLCIDFDRTCGLYYPQSNTLAVASNSNNSFFFSDTFSQSFHPLRIPQGDTLAPSLQFTGDPDTGIYQPAIGQIGIACNGFNLIQCTETDITCGAQVVLKTGGSPTNLALTFPSDPDTGIYSSGANQLALVTNGTEKIHLKSSSIELNNNTYNIDGTEATPAYSFTSAPGCGIWSPVQGALAFSSQAIERFRIDGNIATFSDTTVRYPDGTISLPSIAFVNDVDTGIYRESGSGGLSITHTATEVIRHRSNRIDMFVPAVINGGIHTKVDTQPSTSPYQFPSTTTCLIATLNITLPTIILPDLTGAALGRHVTITAPNNGQGCIIQPYTSNTIQAYTDNLQIAPGTTIQLYGGTGNNWLIRSSYTYPKVRFVTISTSSYTLTTPFREKYIAGAGADITVTLPITASYMVGYETIFITTGAYTITLVPNVADTINGSGSNYVISAGSSRTLFCTGVGTWIVY